METSTNTTLFSYVFFHARHLSVNSIVNNDDREWLAVRDIDPLNGHLLPSKYVVRVEDEVSSIVMNHVNGKALNKVSRYWRTPNGLKNAVKT